MARSRPSIWWTKAREMISCSRARKRKGQSIPAPCHSSKTTTVSVKPRRISNTQVFMMNLRTRKTTKRKSNKWTCWCHHKMHSNNRISCSKTKWSIKRAPGRSSNAWTPSLTRNRSPSKTWRTPIELTIPTCPMIRVSFLRTWPIRTSFTNESKWTKISQWLSNFTIKTVLLNSVCPNRSYQLRKRRKQS